MRLSMICYSTGKKEKSHGTPGRVEHQTPGGANPPLRQPRHRPGRAREEESPVDGRLLRPWRETDFLLGGTRLPAVL